MAPYRLRCRGVIGRQVLGALAGGHHLEPGGARPVDHLADQRRLVAIGQGIDDAGRPRARRQKRPGQRVGFADSPFANAALCAVDVSRLIPLPDEIAFETAAGCLLQGLTAQSLCRDSYAVRPGDWAVVHAAAGGVGLLLVQILKHLGARVIGIASTEAKRQAVREAGVDLVIPTGGWLQAVQSLTGGRGADVVYDSVGTTLRESLDAARTGGTVVFYGMAAGDPAPVDPRLLMDRSLTLVGGDLWNVLTTAQARRTRATELFGWIRSGAVALRISQTVALRDGAQAHRALESRQTIGKIVLLP